MEIRSTCTKEKTVLQEALTMKSDPSGQASWSEFDPAYSVQIFRQLTEAIPKLFFFLIKSRTASSFFTVLHTAAFLYFSFHDIFTVLIVFDILTCWMNKC